MSGRHVRAERAATIRCTREVWRLYKESIARNPPETYALLGGSLDAPDLITDFFYLPPQRDAQGAFGSGPAHVQLDHHAINYLNDHALVPNGRYILGIWHSHPPGCTAPSAPDFLYFAATLRNDDSLGRRWNTFIAPITTFGADGRDEVSVWLLRKGAATFERADFVPPDTTETTPSAPDLHPPRGFAELGPVLAATAAPEDPLVTRSIRLTSLLTQSQGVVGLQRYRMGVHLEAAERCATRAADAVFRD